MNPYLAWLGGLIVLSAWMWRRNEFHEIRARVTIITIFAGLLLASFMPNDWIAVYTVVFLSGLFWVPSPVDRLPLTVYPALLFATIYVLLSPLVTEVWIMPLLWSIASCGIILSLWWGVSMAVSQGHYDKCLTFRGKVILHLYEHQPHWNDKPFFCCGQGNVNFTQALAAMTCAASVGLILLGSRWAWVMLLITALPLIKIDGKWYEWPRPTQGWGYLAVIVVTAFATQSGVSGLVGGASFLIVFTLWAWEAHSALWSGRQEMWEWGMNVWRDMSWRGKLIGAGPESWLHIFQQDILLGSTRLEKQKAFATHSHNEFINALVETGLIGFVCIAGYCVTTLWGLFHVDPAGHALFVLSSTYVACMMISFPVSYYHEVAFMDRGGDVTGHGMPPLNVIGLAIVLLAEGILR